MRKFAVSLLWFLWSLGAAFATCADTVPAGSIQIVACTQANILSNSPSYTISDVNELALGFWDSWSNAQTVLLSGVPVSGQITFTNGNPVLSWPGHGLTAGSYLVLTTTYPNLSGVGVLPANFTASTLGGTQTVYYVIATGLTTNALELSATPGGAAITPSGSSSGAVYGFNLVAGFSAWANSVINLARTQQQAAATTPPSVPAQIPVTPAQ